VGNQLSFRRRPPAHPWPARFWVGVPAETPPEKKKKKGGIQGMAVVAIGTTNPGKVAAVKKAFSKYKLLEDLVFVPTKVPSGVPDQPCTLFDTVTGAKNRALLAKEDLLKRCRSDPCGSYVATTSAAHWGLGLESGLFEDPQGKLFDVCACAIFDGDNYHIGYSSAWALPDAVAEVSCCFLNRCCLPTFSTQSGVDLLL
jgi:non-canonical (house-cleaning) NTP pyrophosphatase